MWNLTITLTTPQEIAGFSIGMLRAGLLIAYNIPTALKLARHKNANAVSKNSLVLQYALQIISLAYGILVEEVPMIVANIGSLSVLVAIAALRCKFLQVAEVANASTV